LVVTGELSSKKMLKGGIYTKDPARRKPLVVTRNGYQGPKKGFDVMASPNID